MLAWGSVPDASRPVMRHALFAPCFQFLHGIVQEEVNQDGIHLGFWVFSLDLPLDQLHTPDTSCCIKLSVAIFTRPR